MIPYVEIILKSEAIVANQFATTWYFLVLSNLPCFICYSCLLALLSTMWAFSVLCYWFCWSSNSRTEVFWVTSLVRIQLIMPLCASFHTVKLVWCAVCVSQSSSQMQVLLMNLLTLLNMKNGLDAMHDANARAVSILHKLWSKIYYILRRLPLIYLLPYLTY